MMIMPIRWPLEFTFFSDPLRVLIGCHTQPDPLQHDKAIQQQLSIPAPTPLIIMFQECLGIWIPCKVDMPNCSAP